MNTDLQYSTRRDFDFNSVYALYVNAGWTSYTSRPDVLREAIRESRFVLTAWSGERIVGFLRAVGDGLTIIYIQDILVIDEYRRQGIGSELLRRTLHHYQNVRQILLLTDNQPETISFYKSVGLQQAHELNVVSFIRLNI
ncbi:MAG: GNAT family N-acetyltransferase [Candidatus Kapabacteria bacterium]|nr:GNAT family N-acetyltransferase [Candidatus Kapabacteria bacterium]